MVAADRIVLLPPSTLLRLDMSLHRLAPRIVNQHLDLMLVEELFRQLNSLPTLLGLYRLFDTFSILATIMNLPNTPRSRHLAISQVQTPAMTIRRRKSSSRIG